MLSLAPLFSCRTLKTIQTFQKHFHSTVSLTLCVCQLTASVFDSLFELPAIFGMASFDKLPVALASGRLHRPWNELPHFCFRFLPRKEVIQPHLPIRLPCYDFTPVIGLALDGWLLAVTSPALGTPNSHGVTGGVYKARERIHRGMLIRDY